MLKYFIQNVKEEVLLTQAKQLAMLDNPILEGAEGKR